jgi:hypothetical protein
VDERHPREGSLTMAAPLTIADITAVIDAAKPAHQRAAMLEALTEIMGELGAALAQSIPSDDQIIIGHVRTAHTLATMALRNARS